MKLRGGYNILLKGRPNSEEEVLCDPEILYLPLQSPRFNFSELCVEDGQQVAQGQILAKDPDNFFVPLLAPRVGTVRLQSVESHIVLENIEQKSEEAIADSKEISVQEKSAESKRKKLLDYGAWQFFYDAFEQSLPDPAKAPQAIILSILRLEPFGINGDAIVQNNLPDFIAGLEKLQSLIEYQPVYLVMPDTKSELTRYVREKIKGKAWVEFMEVPLRYPFDNFTVLARSLGLKRGSENPVWGIRAEGLLAVNKVLSNSQPYTERIISFAGPGVKIPKHLKTVPGYPIDQLISDRVTCEETRVINGGILTGETVTKKTKGIDSECSRFTVLCEHTEREFMGFAMPGFGKHSYSNSFMSLVRRKFRENITTDLRGEQRPCVACGFCEEVCPAGIMPHFIHKLLYQNELEEVEKHRIDLCVGCGLCSFVCPSKLELGKQFSDAHDLIREELHPQSSEPEE